MRLRNRIGSWLWSLRNPRFRGVELHDRAQLPAILATATAAGDFWHMVGRDGDGEMQFEVQLNSGFKVTPYMENFRLTQATYAGPKEAAREALVGAARASRGLPWR